MLVLGLVLRFRPSPGHRYCLTHQTAVPTSSSQVPHPYISFRGNACLSLCLLHPVECQSVHVHLLPTAPERVLRGLIPISPARSSSSPQWAPLLFSPSPSPSRPCSIFLGHKQPLPHRFVSAVPALPWHAAKTPSLANFPPAQNPSEAHIPSKHPLAGQASPALILYMLRGSQGLCPKDPPKAS